MFIWTWKDAVDLVLFVLLGVPMLVWLVCLLILSRRGKRK